MHTQHSEFKGGHRSSAHLVNLALAATIRLRRKSSMARIVVYAHSNRTLPLRVRTHNWRSFIKSSIDSELHKPSRAVF
jgi:hypothetical protein